MKLVHMPINFHDDRGIIRDIFPTGSPDCVTLITSAPRSVRGNHLHKLSTQSAFVVSGTMIAFTRSPITGQVDKLRLLAGDMVVHEPNEEHAYLAIDHVVFLAFAEGLRKGEDYEKDTYRVAPLFDPEREYTIESNQAEVDVVREHLAGEGGPP